MANGLHSEPKGEQGPQGWGIAQGEQVLEPVSPEREVNREPKIRLPIKVLNNLLIFIL